MKNQFKDMKPAEIEKAHDDLVEEYREIRFKEVVGELNDPVKKRNVKRSIARAKTIMHEYKLGIRKQEEQG